MQIVADCIAAVCVASICAMYVYLHKHNCKCPSCFKSLGSRVVSSPRVGREYLACKCGNTLKTIDKEWRHMTTGQRVEYFVSIWAVCWILFFIACGAVEVVDNDRLGAFYGFGIGLACYLPFILWKLLQVRRPVLRTSTTPQRFD